MGKRDAQLPTLSPKPSLWASCSCQQLRQKVASNGPQRLAAGGAATQNSPLVGMVELSITPKVHPKGFGCFPHTPREEAAEDLLLLLTLTRKHESQDGGS
jgi:hypothetical protein